MIICPPSIGRRQSLQTTMYIYIDSTMTDLNSYLDLIKSFLNKKGNRVLAEQLRDIGITESVIAKLDDTVDAHFGRQQWI
jgi:hypothetical protein